LNAKGAPAAPFRIAEIVAVQSDFLLMVDPVHDKAQPVSPRAFEAMAAPKSQVMARNCVALFLNAAGQVLHLDRVTPKRAGPWTEARLWFGRSVPASYEFEEVEMPLGDMKTMILDAATYMRLQPDTLAWWLSTAPLDEVQGRIAEVGSLADLHAAIPFPADRDCLALL